MLPDPAPEWEEPTVRSILTSQGQLVHSVAGVGDADWVYTDNDLQAIAPPLTRILNRYPVTRAAAGTGDELALIIGLGGYVSRSYRERRAVLELLADQEPEPITGVGPDEEELPGHPDPEPEGGIEWATP